MLWGSFAWLSRYWIRHYDHWQLLYAGDESLLFSTLAILYCVLFHVYSFCLRHDYFCLHMASLCVQRGAISVDFSIRFWRVNPLMQDMHLSFTFFSSSSRSRLRRSQSSDTCYKIIVCLGFHTRRVFLCAMSFVNWLKSLVMLPVFSLVSGTVFAMSHFQSVLVFFDRIDVFSSFKNNLRPIRECYGNGTV